MAHPHDGASGPGPHGRRPASHPSTPSAAVLTPPTGLPAVEPTAPASIPQQRTPAEPVAPPPADPGVRLCACGHPEDMHDHYRPGTDCGACGARACGSFRPADADRPRTLLGKLFRRN